MKNIKITGKDIIELDGLDHTGAFNELGVEYEYKGEGLDINICNLKFGVDLDFILRHGLMNDEIYKKYYKSSPQYKKYYNEGKQAFLDGKDDPCDNPYTDKTIKDKDYWLDDLQVKGYPWYDGYREAQGDFLEEKYKIKEMQKQIKSIIKQHNMTVYYEEEYNHPFAKTEEGDLIRLA